MKYKKEEYEELFSISLNRAINSIKHFFELLCLDESLFNNLYNTSISIDFDSFNVYDDECATCDLGNSKRDAHIYIGISYLDCLISRLKNNYNKQIIINDLATTIIHELMHVNRSVLIKERFNIDTIRCIRKFDSSKKEDTILSYDKDDRNISIYNVMLENSIISKFYDYFDDLVPLKVKDNSNDTYDIVAYSKKKNAYMFFDNTFIYCKYGVDSTLLYVGLELNSNLIKREPSYIVYLKNDNLVDKVYDAADFIHQDSKEKINKKRDRIDNQVSFEETLVEVLAQMILQLRKSKSIDYKYLDKYFDGISLMDEQLGYKLIKKLGNSRIKWFMLSSREEYYDDKMYKTFNDKYDLLMSSFFELRNNTCDNEEYNINSINDINTIIEEEIFVK